MSVRVERGTLLLSAPEMQDPNFMHTVVLMCQHTEDGAFGVVVNRPGEARVSEVLSEHPVASQLELTVRGGGPVGLDTLQILHRVPHDDLLEMERSLHGLDLGDGMRLGADLDEIANYAKEKGSADSIVRFVVGYSGWGAGQLDDEIATGSWLPLRATQDLVFSNDTPEAVWRAAVARLGGGGSSLAHLPPDTSWN